MLQAGLSTMVKKSDDSHNEWIQKAREAKAAAEEALKNAKSEIDLARAQSELAIMAAQIAALRKFRQKR